MSLKLLRQALDGKPEHLTRLWHVHPLSDHYDVVIIGGGAHGLACAYYLAKEHGITHVAVMEKKYIGHGGSGRNTTIIRHDAVVWGYAHQADKRGVHIHQATEVTGLRVAERSGRVTGVETSKGFVGAGAVLNATAGWGSTVAAMAELKLPLVTSPLQ